MKIITFIAVLLLIQNVSFGLEKKADYRIYELNNVVRDKDQIYDVLGNWYKKKELYKDKKDDTFFIIGMYYYLHGKYDSAINYIDPIISMKKNDNVYLEAVRYKGIIQDRSGDTHTALTTLKSIENNPALINNNPYSHLIYLNTIGIVYENLSMYDSSIAIYDRALSFVDDIENPVFKMNLFYSIACAQTKKFDYGKAMSYADSCLSISLSFEKKTMMTYKALLLMSDISKLVNTPEETLKIYNEVLTYEGEIEHNYIIGQAYYHKYNLLRLQLNRDEVDLLYKSKDYLTKSGDKIILSLTLIELSNKYIRDQALDSANYYADKAISLLYRPKMNKYLAAAYSIKAKVLLAENNTKDALKYSLEAYRYISNNDKDDALSNYKTHLEVFKKEGKKDEALAVAEYIINNRSNYIKNNDVKKLAQQQFVMDKKYSDRLFEEKKLQEQQKREKYIYLSVFLFIVVIGLIYFSYIIKKAKDKTAASLLEIEKQKAFIAEQNEKLASLDEMKNKFFAQISHEFRTPLTLIKGPAQDLERELEGHQKESMGIIIKHSNRLLTLINKILNLASIRNRKNALQLSQITYSEYLKKFKSNYESLVKGKNLGFTIKQEGNVDVGYFDLEHLETILNNLVHNAVKYTHTGGIKITFQSSIDHLTIKVLDTGEGILKEKLKHIFDEFYNDKNKSTSIGLGLAICKELCNEMGGSISVESEVNFGTEFTIILPSNPSIFKEKEIEYVMANDVVSTTLISNIVDEKQEETVTDLSNNDAIRDVVLVIDDNADIRNYLKHILNDHYKLHFAINGQEGLDKAIKYQPDIILTDLMMPKMDGHELLLRIKENELVSHIPVIMLTAKGDDVTRLESLKLQADNFINKPFSSEEILHNIKNKLNFKKRLFRKFANFALNQEAAVELPSVEQQFIERVNKAIDGNIDQPDFGVEELAQEVGVSRSQLHRKLKGLINESTSAYLRKYRLNKAYKEVKESDLPISEIADKYGFNSLSYFTKTFKDEYSLSPSEVRNQNAKAL